MTKKPTNADDKCPKFESEEWKAISNADKEKCKKKKMPENTTKYLAFNSLNMVIIAIIGGFVFAIALLIVEPIKEQYGNAGVWVVVIILFSLVMLCTLGQFFIERQKKFYEKQIN